MKILLYIEGRVFAPKQPLLIASQYGWWMELQIGRDITVIIINGGEGSSISSFDIDTKKAISFSLLEAPSTVFFAVKAAQ